MTTMKDLATGLKTYKAVTGLRGKLVRLLTETPAPISDDVVHAFAEKEGLDPSVVEQEAYAILTDFFQAGDSAGKSFTPDKNELALGMREEMEHTKCPLIARKITMDHLAKNPRYYTEVLGLS